MYTYIRIREIFHSFLKFRYGEAPFEIPLADELYAILRDGLAPNYKMSRMCYSTFSKAAYDADPKTSRDCYLPSEEDKRKLLAFSIPAYVKQGRRFCQTDKWYQLKNKAYRDFVKLVEHEFWEAFIKFDIGYRDYCLHRGVVYSQECSIEKFMLLIDMDVNLEDTTIRYWTEYKRKNKDAYQAAVASHLKDVERRKRRKEYVYTL